MKKVKVLTFSVYYLPGYKGGGPIRTIENMVSHLDDDLEFWIVTRDRDSGDTCPYPAVTRGEWHKQGNAYVYYLPQEETSLKAIGSIIKNTAHDIVYLNSFFDPVFTVFPLLHRYFGRATMKPFVLAPRGEFAEAALKIKKFKKSCYLKICRILGLTKGLLFQASSEYELNDIKYILGVNESSIRIALDLPSKKTHAIAEASLVSATVGDPLRVIFLSRISPMKNLDFAIRALMSLRSSVQFDIYGPKEDLSYWAQCEQLLNQLPHNIKSSYCGNVLPDNVKDTFSRYDLFLFPTRGENYGHVIAESISAGTPVLLSDRTPWRTLDENGLGWVIPLDSPELFSKKIEMFSSLPCEQRNEKRRQILKFSEENFCNPESINQNRDLFLSLTNSRSQ